MWCEKVKVVCGGRKVCEEEGSFRELGRRGVNVLRRFFRGMYFVLVLVWGLVLIFDL